MKKVSEKTREMVAALDEIVWAVNPTNDALSNMANYLSHFAYEFFKPTPILCRLDVDDALPSETWTSEVRHSVYLAVREALNNVSKHSGASEVWLRIQLRTPELLISVTDDGCGFSPQDNASLGSGLGNMRHRLQRIGGRFELESHPGAGTTCRFWLPLAARIRTERERTSVG